MNQHLTKVLSSFNIGDVNPEVPDLQKQSESGSSGSSEDVKQRKQVNPEVPDPLSISNSKNKGIRVNPEVLDLPTIQMKQGQT